MTPGRAPSTWAASGAAWLTGHEGGPPLDAPPGVETVVSTARSELVANAPVWAGESSPELDDIDAMALLGERAALTGLHRQGRRSCGGSTRLVRARDGWIAVALPRADDLELVPAWLGETLHGWARDPDALDVEWLEALLAGRSTRSLVDKGALVGLAVGALGEVRSHEPVRALLHRPGPALGRPPLVLDLSALWAGPLCCDLLARAGAEVVKVEALGRPDGLRHDRSGFFDLLNAHKRCVALELTTPEGRLQLRQLIDAADVVIEGSRPRALEQLGLDADGILRSAPSKVWLSITAHGRRGADAMRVGFGDDTAVAGGLVAWDAEHRPCFLADAVADPLTGLVAAAATSSALAAGGAWLIDVALARVAATASQGVRCPSPVLDEGAVARPRARVVRERAEPLGASTDEVLARTAESGTS